MTLTFRELTQKEFEKFTKSCPSKRYMQSAEMYERYQKTAPNLTYSAFSKTTKSSPPASFFAFTKVAAANF